ncbi:MAG: hypothetical protein HDQ96_14650 [Lachnospiraceae bacterium]|nr:hypothetical protein [Lachnospiraceae bacterium]
MGGLSVSELILYGGISAMVLSGILALLCITVFSITGRKLKEQLEKEYGKQEL